MKQTKFYSITLQITALFYLLFSRGCNTVSVSTVVTPSLSGYQPSVTAVQSSVTAVQPSVTAVQPSVTAVQPSVTAVQPSVTAGEYNATVCRERQQEVEYRNNKTTGSDGRRNETETSVPWCNETVQKEKPVSQAVVVTTLPSDAAVHSAVHGSTVNDTPVYGPTTPPPDDQLYKSLWQYQMRTSLLKVSYLTFCCLIIKRIK